MTAADHARSCSCERAPIATKIATPAKSRPIAYASPA
jgi:hypothetical protein